MHLKKWHCGNEDNVSVSESLRELASVNLSWFVSCTHLWLVPWLSLGTTMMISHARTVQQAVTVSLTHMHMLLNRPLLRQARACKGIPCKHKSWFLLNSNGILRTLRHSWPTLNKKHECCALVYDACVFLVKRWFSTFHIFHISEYNL